MNRFAEVIVALRWWTLAAVLALFGASAAALPGVEFSLSISPLIEGGEAAQARETRLQREVPPQTFHYVAILTWPRRIEIEDLRAVDLAHGALEADARIRRVVSLARVPVLLPGDLLPRTFLRAFGDADPVAAARARPLLDRRLISADGHSLALLIRGQNLSSAPMSREEKDGRLDWLDEFLRQRLGDPVQVRIVSGYVAERARRGYMERDLFLIIGLELLVAALVLPLVFRSVRGTVLPLAAVVCALTVCLAVLRWTGGTLGIIELAIPGLIIMIGLSDAIHLVHRFEEVRSRGVTTRGSIVAMAGEVGTACLITSVTTAIGFLSLLVADHAAVRAFGVKAAAAVMLTFAVTLLVLPLGLAFCRARQPRPARLPALHRLALGRGRLVLVLAVLATAWGVAGILQIRVEARWLEELPITDPIRADVDLVDEQFSGILEIEAAIHGDLSTPEAIHALEVFQAEVARSPDVLRVESISHWLRAALGDPKESLTAEQVRQGFARLRLAGRSFFPRHLVGDDLSVGRVVFHTPNLPSSRFLALRDQVRSKAAAFAPNLHIEPMGYGLMAQENALLVSVTLLESLALSLAAITLLISILFRSIRLGLVSIIPNALPILIALGVNGWLDIPLRLGIVMIYSLGLGIAVDDTIHLLTRYVQQRRAHPEQLPIHAMEASLRSAGAALVITTLVLTCGAFCFLPAHFRSIHDVGILLTVILLTALLCDLFVLPLLVLRGHRDPDSRRNLEEI